MGELIAKNGEKLTGKLSLKHRVILNAFGNLLIGLGNLVKSVKTYEQLAKIEDEGNRRIEEFEERYGEEDTQVLIK